MPLLMIFIFPSHFVMVHVLVLVILFFTLFFIIEFSLQGYICPLEAFKLILQSHVEVAYVPAYKEMMYLEMRAIVSRGT